MRARQQSRQHLVDLRRAGHDEKNEAEPPELAWRHQRHIRRELCVGPRGFRNVPCGRKPARAIEIARNAAPHVAETDDSGVATTHDLLILRCERSEPRRMAAYALALRDARFAGSSG